MHDKPQVKITYDHGVQQALGERKYPTYMEALNEAIQNSFDNRATCVDVEIAEDCISVKDDGAGMDEKTLNDEYLRIGKLNVDPSKAGLFGIGCLGQRALSRRSTIETHVAGAPRGIRVAIDWNAGAGSQIEGTSWIESPVEMHGTIMTLTDLRYRPGDPQELLRYLERKHFPRLKSARGRLNLRVNGKPCQIVTPEYEVKYEFDSTEPFTLGGKTVPAVPNATFGKVTGIIYLTKPDKDNTTHVYDRLGGRLDAYSDRDWLKLTSLTSGGAFKARISAILNTTTELVISDIPTQRCLMIRSDRGGFFEDVPSYRALVEYLNGRPHGENLGLPDGGILRLIHGVWLESYQAQREQKFEKESDEAIKSAIPILSQALKDEDTVWKADAEGADRTKPRKHAESTQKGQQGAVQPRKRLQCPKCSAFNYITIVDYKVFVQNPNPDMKLQMRRNWPCKVCGYYLNPETDLHKIKSPEKKSGVVSTGVKIGKGKLVDVQHQGLGPAGDIAICDITDEFIHVNDQHALYKRAYGVGRESLLQHVITAALYSLAKAKEGELGLDFEQEFNRLCSNLHNVVEIGKPRTAETQELHA
jgi:hypothetical protein